MNAPTTVPVSGASPICCNKRRGSGAVRSEYLGKEEIALAEGFQGWLRSPLLVLRKLRVAASTLGRNAVVVGMEEDAMRLQYEALASDLVAELRAGGPDAYGLPAERVVSDGAGNPCRHCLGFVPEGAGMLILAHRPFAALHPYAETGPIFLCADGCARHPGDDLPPVLTSSPDYLLKGYSADERIVYGTGRVVVAGQIGDYAAQLLSDPRVAFVDVRSARNNCFQLRMRVLNGAS